MPKEKEYEKLIPKIYRRKYEDIALLFFVDGQRSIMPAISVEKALYNFFKYISEEDYNIESALTTYQRLKKEYYESSKTHIHTP
jgi:hypothetical protein